jgi:hypothetical protein
MRVSYARFVKRPDWLPRNDVRTGARAAGERYERAVHAALLKRYPGQYVEGPWIAYRCNERGSRLNFCQPDGLYFDIQRGLIVIIEVKLKHGVKAYKQLHDLYLPVIRHIFEDFEIRLIEVVKWFDPAIKTGNFLGLCSTIHECAPLRADMYNVHILRP